MRLKLSTAAIAGVLAIGAVTATAGSASAYVVCNARNECWHTDTRYRYDAPVRAVRHADDWYFHRDWDHDKSYQWRQYHQGRGYYDNGVWVPR